MGPVVSTEETRKITGKNIHARTVRLLQLLIEQLYDILSNDFNVVLLI